MSIIVENLTKEYGTQRAVDCISFEARSGEVLGFLGPNGAGKSTTMKILTCFIPQTSGKASVCGYDVEEHSLEVRKRIGYLPEHNPLYMEMYVREYLEFIARLHHLAKPRQRIDEMIEMTGLEREQRKHIGELSKGYRQRVGLAQAMLHNPDVLILDEPTSGLDPNQLVEIRQLIKNLGREKTVVFSTHIMQEVQALCDRVLIINRGRIVADDPIDQLSDRVQGEVVITVEFAGPVPAKALKTIKHVRKVEPAGQHRWQLFTPSGHDIRKDVFEFAVKNKLVLLEMHREEFSVEGIFQQLTQN